MQPLNVLILKIYFRVHTFRHHYNNTNICEYPKVTSSIIEVDPPGP
jgi:hypothetical protein